MNVIWPGIIITLVEYGLVALMPWDPNRGFFCWAPLGPASRNLFSTPRPTLLIPYVWYNTQGRTIPNRSINLQGAMHPIASSERERITPLGFCWCNVKTFPSELGLADMDRKGTVTTWHAGRISRLPIVFYFRRWEGLVPWRSSPDLGRARWPTHQ